MINELVTRVFASRDAAHLKHWATSSYAEHQALGQFYDEIIDRLDTLVESYQGRFGVVKDIELKRAMGDILDVLAEDVRWITENHMEICQEVSALGNLLDTIVDLYLTTIYKIENLK